MDACDECGFVYDTPRTEIVTAIRGFGRRYAELLEGRSEAELRRHDRDGVWSPLEYACHVRDVFLVQRGRVAQALAEHEPAFTSMRRDERAVEERYNEQDPATVIRQLNAAADDLASSLEALDGAGWERTGLYAYRGPEVRTIEWIARHTIHEGVHHVMDIERQLD